MDIVALLADARRPAAGRRGPAAAGLDPLRGAGRGDRDEHRAPGDPQPRDRGPADRRGAARVAGVRRARRARAARARRARSRFDGTPEIRARDRRDRARATSAIARACARAATRSSTAARCSPTGPNSRPPTARPTSSIVDVPDPAPDDGRFALSTRRGKQFNSMVQEHADAITGAGPRGGADRGGRRRAARASPTATRCCSAASSASSRLRRRRRPDRARQPPGPLARGQRADRPRPALAGGGGARLQRPGRGRRRLLRSSPAQPESRRSSSAAIAASSAGSLALARSQRGSPKPLELRCLEAVAAELLGEADQGLAAVERRAQARQQARRVAGDERLRSRRGRHREARYAGAPARRAAPAARGGRRRRAPRPGRPSDRAPRSRRRAGWDRSSDSAILGQSSGGRSDSGLATTSGSSPAARAAAIPYEISGWPASSHRRLRPAHSPARPAGEDGDVARRSLVLARSGCRHDASLAAIRR